VVRTPRRLNVPTFTSLDACLREVSVDFVLTATPRGVTPRLSPKLSQRSARAQDQLIALAIEESAESDITVTPLARPGPELRPEGRVLPLTVSAAGADHHIGSGVRR
jgi:hypothetical protein